MLIAIIPVFMMLLGLLLYVLSSNAKVQELGRLTFAAGAFAFGVATMGRTISIP